MFKKTLLAAAALSFMALGVSQAHATYGYNYNNYSHKKHHKHHNFSWYNTYPWYKQFVYKPSCYFETRPVTIKLWDEYSYSYYFKTIYREVKVCY